MKLVMPFVAVVGMCTPAATLSAQPSRASDQNAVQQVLARYKSAIERLDATGAQALLAPAPLGNPIACFAG